MSTELTLADAEFPVYRPSDGDRDYVASLLRKFSTAREMREKSYKVFNNRSPEQYWHDGELRWNSHIPAMRKKDWQAKVVKPITRTKCIGIIAYVLSSLIEPDFFAVRNGRYNDKVASALRDLFDLSEELDRSTQKYLLMLVDAVSMGTAFMQEDYVRRLRKVREVTKWDPATGEISFDEKEIVDFEGFVSSIVSPYEVYLGNVFEYDMRLQPYVFRRTVMPYGQAKSELGHLPNFAFVRPHSGGVLADDEFSFVRPFDERDLAADEVEVLRYQCMPDDEVAVLVNGVLLVGPGMPMPYNHKAYSLVKVVFEPISKRCAYGKSLTDRLMGEQDVIDTLYRMVIDKTFLNLFPPLLSKGREAVTSDVMQPGKVTPVDSETEVTAVDKVAGGVGNELNLIALIEKSMNSSSIDESMLGQSAGGERSATQVLEAKAGAQKVLGLFAYMVSFALEDLADLRVQNILQFWAKWQPFADETDSEAVESVFEVPDRRLRSDKNGSRLLKFAPENLHPAPMDILREQMDLSRAKGKPVEVVYLDPEKIRNYKYYVRVKANPTERLSPALEKALGVEFYSTFQSNPLISLDKLTRETVRLFKKNPDDLMASPEQARQAKMAQTLGAEGPKRGNLQQQLQGAMQPQLQALVRQ